jgi:acyl-CoA synthetase (NDP forming)
MDLSPLMNPRSIAVVGASQRGGRGTRVIANLQHFGYAGAIYPINPRYPEILGLTCYADLASTPDAPDSVVVAIPGEHVPALLAAAVERGVRGAVVLSSGFAEAGPEGRRRQQAIERLVAERGLLVCGPNCYGVFNVRLGAATYSADIVKPWPAGPVAIVSQSGGFSHAVAEHLVRQRAVGISYVVSCGNQAGVSVEDYVHFLVEDDDTDVVGVFVEGFRKPARLREAAARAREREKPIVVLKVGRSESARQAMLAHTGSLAGSTDIIDATLRQAGVIQVASLNEMLDTVTLAAAARRHRRGWRVTVLSGLGGECGRVADVADAAGVELPALASETRARLRAVLPDFASARNPLDGTGTMYDDTSLFPRLFDVLLQDEGTDVLAFNTRATIPRPGGWAPARQFAQTMRDALKGGTDRLVLCFNSFAGADLDPEIVGPLAEVGVPFLESTETAMRAIRHVRDHRRFLDQAPTLVAIRPTAPFPVDGHGVLDNTSAMRLLRAFGIPIAETRAAGDADAAARAAEAVGFPVVVKIDSPDIAHKTDIGGVRTGCGDAAAVRRAFEDVTAAARQRAPQARVDGVLVQREVSGGIEMIIGVQTDPQFGPAVVCGFGGVLVEVLRDVAVRVPPLDIAGAREMLEELRGHALLRGVRGRPAADIRALAETIVRVTALAEAGVDRLRALDLNPLFVLENGRGVVAADWLIELAASPANV